MATGTEIKNVYDMMQKICDETSTLISIINDMFENKGFEAVGGSGVMMNKSNSYLNPSYWLPHSLQRMFSKDTNSKKGIGVNIMFDGSNEGLYNKIPFLTCGIVETPNEKVTKSFALYRAGWLEHEAVLKEFENSLCTTTFTDGVIAKTYFLPLDLLTCKEDVYKYILTPLLLMYEGEMNEANNCVSEVALQLNQIIGEVNS